MEELLLVVDEVIAGSRGKEIGEMIQSRSRNVVTTVNVTKGYYPACEMDQLQMNDGNVMGTPIHQEVERRRGVLLVDLLR